MDIKTVKQRLKDGKLVKWRNKCWYVRSLDEARQEVSLDDRRVAYVGTIISADHVPIRELNYAYWRKQKG